MQLCPSCGNMNPDDTTSCLRCQAAMEGEAPAAQAPSPGGVSFSSGTTLGDGRYLLESHLGEGGMGNVFLAKDTRLGRTLALKILSAALVGHSQAWNRMDREGKALALIDHPNVVRIHDIFDEGPFLVLALEYVPGGDLRSRTEEGRLETAEIVRLMGGVLEGLTAIHEAGFVHRDMKPGNVLLTESGVPKVADLGVAHESQGRSMTRTGTQLGTPEYMAPEQVEGKKVDPRTDLYACGIILFELLSGQVPFAGDSDYAIFHGHVQTEPDLDMLSEAPGPLVAVVRRALAKDPEERWPSAAAMAQALRSEVEVEPSPRPVPVSPPEPTAPEVKPPPTLEASEGATKEDEVQAPPPTEAKWVGTCIKGVWWGALTTLVLLMSSFLLMPFEPGFGNWELWLVTMGVGGGLGLFFAVMKAIRRNKAGV